MLHPPIPGLRLPFGWIFLGVVAVVLVLGFGAKLLRVRTTGMPAARAIRAGDHIAILYSTVEPYIPSLHHRPETETTRIDLRLIPIRAGEKEHRVSVVRDIRRSQSMNNVGFIGVDGEVVWFTAGDLFGYNFRSRQLIREADLRRVNPDLGALLREALFTMDGRLVAFTRDYQRAAFIDPTTLHATRGTWKPKPGWTDPHPKPEAFLCRGARISTNEWLGASSDADLESDFKPRFRLPRNDAIADVTTRAQRKLHLSRLRQEEDRTVIESTSVIGTTEYLAAAFVRSAVNGPALRLAGPDGVLMAYRTSHGFEGIHRLMRIDSQGQAQWTIDTEISDLDEVLPHPETPAFIGRRPRIPNKLQDLILVIVDAQDGRTTTHFLPVSEW